MKHLFTFFLGAAVLAASEAPATAQRTCAPRERVVQRLADRYGETRQSIGLGADNELVEVYASRKTGTWTIVATLPSGVSCLIASGKAFERLAEALPAAGDDL